MKLFIALIFTITVLQNGRCEEFSPLDLLRDAADQGLQIDSPLELLQQAIGTGSKNGHESNLTIDVNASGNAVNQNNNLSPLEVLENAANISSAPIDGQLNLGINDDGSPITTQIGNPNLEVDIGTTPSATGEQDPLDLLAQALGQQGSVHVPPPQTAEDRLIQQLLEQIRQNALRLNAPRQSPPQPRPTFPPVIQAPRPIESPLDRFPSMASGGELGFSPPRPTFPPMLPPSMPNQINSPQFGFNQNQLQPQFPNNVQLQNNWNYQQPRQQFNNPVYVPYNPNQNQFQSNQFRSNQFQMPLSKHELHRMQHDERRAIRDMQRQRERLAGTRF